MVCIRVVLNCLSGGEIFALIFRREVATIIEMK